MRTIFEMGFRNGFMPMLGQDSPFITSIDQGPPAEPYPGAITSYDQGPPSEPLTGAVTSYDQLTPSTPSTPSAPSAPSGRATPPTKPAGTSDSDWAKILATGITAGAAGYGAYTKEQVAAINAEAAKKAAAAKPGGAPGAAAGGGPSANTIFLVGGVAVVGIIAAIALK